MMRRFVSRIAGAFRKGRLDEEFDEEVREHLEMLQERFIRRGMAPAEAFYAARRQFGGVTRVTQDVREGRGLPLIDALLRDIRHAFRRLWRSKQFALAASLTLALGIGATTAVFAVLHAVVLQPLPYGEPDRLTAFRSLDRRNASQPALLSYPTFLDFREQNRVFDNLVAYRDASFTLTDSLPAIQVTGEIVSWDLFPLLGIRPQLGRGFRPEEERPGTHVAVLSHALWTTRFARDSAIIGKAIPINSVPFTVVGVAPEHFRFPLDVPAVQLWVTLSEDAAVADQRGGRMLEAIGRLKRGVSLDQARSQMDLVAGALARQYPDTNANFGTVWIQPELKRLTDGGEKPMWIMLGAVALVLLIACANVASLLLARSIERAREFALQIALGASRPALVRQLLVESLALGLLGTAAGVLLAMGGLNVILPLAGDDIPIPRLAETSVDWQVLTFSAVLAALTSVLFGLAPALQAAAADPVEGLKEGARSIAPGRDRFRSTLVVGQIALGLVLLVGAALLMASFLRLMRQDPGFRADHLLTFEIGLSGNRYPVAGQIAFADRLLERVAAIPGVEVAAAGTPLPLQGHEMRIAFDIEGRRAAAPDRPRADMAIVTPGYFAAMGIPLLKGRDFSDRDDGAAAPVLVVNQAFARKFFPGEDALGKRVQPGAGRPPVPMREIVGVVGDAKQSGVGTDADPIYYLAYKQLPWRLGTIVVRTAVPPLEIEAPARAVLASLDPQVPMRLIRTGEELSSAVIVPARFLTVLLGSFAAIAVLLTVTGLYGLLSSMVAKRQREIGVRIALGAARGEVIGLVWRRAVLLVTTGLILGSAGAYGVARLLGSLESGSSSGLPAILGGACCILAMTSAVAAFVPAARAASVDPMQAFRSE
jgi:putative ABC transport system permease protein